MTIIYKTIYRDIEIKTSSNWTKSGSTWTKSRSLRTIFPIKFRRIEAEIGLCTLRQGMEGIKGLKCGLYTTKE